MCTIIRTENLSKVYGEGDGKVKALDNVSVSFEKGQMTAIIGASGSGKTTLLNILGLLDTSVDGKVFYNDEDVMGCNDSQLAKLRNTKIGYVFQFFKLIPELSAKENILLPIMISGEKTDKVDLKSLTDSLGISERLSHYPSQLSGGQQQRVAIARALINDPEIILCDEPTGALDTNSAADIMKLLHELNEKGKTVIIVTHDHGIAKQCSRVIEIVDGKVRK
ncbi:MAG: ABC transporter ATP-binding protein [Ruminococcus sp.]|nr:ABC transporter ATP-binding protein [Ruminococcus sp.]